MTCNISAAAEAIEKALQLTYIKVATLLSQTGVKAGGDSHLCQFQGFLIQMYERCLLEQCQTGMAKRNPGFYPPMPYGISQWPSMFT